MKFKITLVCWIFILSFVACKNDKEKPIEQKCGPHSNPYSLDIVHCTEDYQNQVKDNPDMELIDLEKVVPNIVLDIRYATANNFTSEVIYTEAKAYARKPVSNALIVVQDSLASLNLGLKVYDAYRPYAATVKFYEVYPDTNFVANPKYGSRHNRGCAVDVTLVNRTTGEDISMPTEFDAFTDAAHPDYMDLPQEVINNRTLLFNIMAHFGFTHYPTEWWHFDYQGWDSYPLMDLSFDQLSK